MFSFKIWPLVLAIYSSILFREQVFLSASYISDEVNRHSNIIVGGNVGCLTSDVCLPTETCEDDDLFGKCVEGKFDKSVFKLNVAERSLLTNIKADLFRFGLDFSDEYVQCVFRGLILKFRLQDKNMDIVELCGELPREVFDFKGDIHVPEFQSLFPVEDYIRTKLATKKWSLPYGNRRVIRYTDRDDSLEQRIRRNEFRPLNSDGSLSLNYAKHVFIPYEDTSPLNYLDDLPGAYAKRQLQRKTMPLKRFNRDKVVKVGSAEFDRRTKNTIWIRLDRPVNYIEADEFLRELSEDLDIRPPIAQFQLDKTGRVLLFFVPFETGLVASDVTSMMGQNPQWLKQNKIAEMGIGLPLLTEPVAAPHTVAKIEQLSEVGNTPARVIRGETEGGSINDRVSRVGFILVVVLCSLAVLAAVLLFVQYIVRRRENLGGYTSSTKAKGSRKISERPLVASGSPSRNASNHNGFSGNQLEGSPTSSIGSPAPVQETAGQNVKQG